MKNNHSPYFKDWTTAKLKQEARELDQLINEVECYGTGDLRMLVGVLAELDKRGIEITNKLTFN